MKEKQQQQQQQQQQQDQTNAKRQFLAKEKFSPQITKFRRERIIHSIKMKHGHLILLISHL